MSATTLTISARPPSMWGCLHYRDYRFLLIATVMQNLTMPVQFITLSFWAVDTYPDEKTLISSLLIGVRGAGMLTFSFVGGALADRFERRKVLRVTEVSSVIMIGLMGVCMVTMPFGDLTIVAIVLLVLRP